MMDTEKINTGAAPLAEEAPVSMQQPASSEPNTEIVSLIQQILPDADVASPEAITESATIILRSLVPLHDKLYDLARTNPETAATLSDWLDTGNLVKSIARNFSEEEKQALIEELEDEEYEEDRKIYSEKTKAIKDRESLLEKNMAEAQMGAQQFVDEKGLSKEDVDQFIPFVDRFIADVKDHKLTKDNWNIIWNAYRHDTDVSEAEENGRVVGRNEQIVAQKKTRDDIKQIMPESTASSAITPKEEKPRSFGSKWLDDI